MSIQFSLHQVIVKKFLLEITALIGFRNALPKTAPNSTRPISNLVEKTLPAILKINAIYPLKRRPDACKAPQNLKSSSRITGFI
jgi:hypothetical protein